MINKGNINNVKSIDQNRFNPNSKGKYNNLMIECNKKKINIVL